MKIFLVFKTHFDIGFTDLSEKIIDQYAGNMLSQVIETCDGTAGMGPLKYVWTMPSWPLTVMQRARPEQRAALDRLVANHQIAWHALPFTSHFDFGSIEEALHGLTYARTLSEQYGLPLPISAKMTDVPGHGRLLPTLLAGAGVRFLHLGCNEFATPPAVPLLYFWQGPDGARLLTMYGAGGYGSTLTPPEGWDYPVWMSLMHTHDNCGPQTTEMLHGIVDEVRAKCPDAEIVCGTMDDFYRALAACDLSAVPVVSEDLADTWIHGAGTYPAETRTVRRTRGQLVAAEAAAALCGADVSQQAHAALDALMLFDEHTWGLDVKTWLPADRVYEKEAFRAAKTSSAYRRMERSWDEQRARAGRAAQCTQDAFSHLGTDAPALFNPNGAPFSGWVRTAGEGVQLCGASYVYGQQLPALAVSPRPTTAPSAPLTLQGDMLQNHRYRLTIDRARGVITELFDKKRDRVLLRERDGVGVFSYRYDVYGTDDLTEYLRTYAHRFSDWGVRDNGRDNYPECPHETPAPVFEALTIEGCTVSLHYRGAGHDRFGDADRITVSVALPPLGEELLVRVALNGKAETPFVESGSLALPMGEDSPRWRFNKNGDLLDPAHHIGRGCNHALYCLEACAMAEDESGGLCVVTHDTPLCAIGETGIYAFRPTYEPHAPILYLSLYNNMWGTNFPQWLGGDLKFDVTLFGYTAPDAPYARALALYQGVHEVPLAPAQSPLSLPAGVQVVFLRREAGGALALCLRDTTMSARDLTLAAPGYMIGKTDLRGTPEGAPARDEIRFAMPAFGIKAFRLEEIQGNGE